MFRYRYVVTELGAARGRLFDRSVRAGQEFWLTDGEAETPLHEGLVCPEAPMIEAAEAPAKRDPLDHDGNGRKGGSLKGTRRRRSV